MPRSRILIACAAWVIAIAAAPVGATGDKSGRGVATLPTLPSGSLATAGDEVMPPPVPALPAGAPQPLGAGRVLYFVASDHDASVTCLFLMNSTAAQQTVKLEGFNLTGVLSGVWNVTVEANSTTRACSDSIVASPPPSWAAVTIVNFTDFVNYVRATLPAGVLIDGFITNNAATGTFDPRASSNTLELRFSPDVPSTSVLYFSAQDSDTTATCLNLYNTSAVDASVQVRGYYTGVLSYSLNIAVAAGALVRACSDSLVATPPPSWVGMTVVNFTDFTSQVELTLPPFVKVDGFVLWNAGTGVVDPRDATSNYLALRFDDDPSFVAPLSARDVAGAATKSAARTSGDESARGIPARPALPSGNVAAVGDEVVPPPVPGLPAGAPQPLGAGRVLYFVASDHDASVTCLFLMNSTAAQQTVKLEGFNLTGVLSGVWNVTVEAQSTTRACSDSIVASPPPSWAAATIVNFTDFVNYVRATLPAGVLIDGFITNNAGTGTYDPRASSNTLELRFSPDVPSTSVVYFSAQDHDANATCLNLYNTSAVDATVQVRGYYTGVLNYSLNIAVAAGALVRACSDSLVAAPPPSWVGMTVVNFTDFVSQVELTLPPFVKVDGFVLWNAGTGVVDPRDATSNYLALRFDQSAGATPAFQGAAARRIHGVTGPFDLPLSLVPTNPTTEPRQGPAQSIAFTFDKPLNAATVTVTAGAATAGAPTFSGNDVVVPLSGVTNQQYVTVSLTDVTSTDGGVGGSASVRVGFLAGDVNQSRVVSVADLGLVNAQLAQPVTAANFIKDVNASGTLTVADKGITNANLTRALPPP